MNSSRGTTMSCRPNLSSNLFAQSPRSVLGHFFRGRKNEHAQIGIVLFRVSPRRSRLFEASLLSSRRGQRPFLPGPTLRSRTHRALRPSCAHTPRVAATFAWRGRRRCPETSSPSSSEIISSRARSISLRYAISILSPAFPCTCADLQPSSFRPEYRRLEPCERMGDPPEGVEALDKEKLRGYPASRRRCLR